MSHHQSHQHQPQNPSNVARNLQPVATSTPSANKLKARDPGAENAALQPSAENIRARAYQISQARNGGPGNAVSDWSQAERELTREATAKA